jgi:tetratricopeptide (TPR) repeat protein
MKPSSQIGIRLVLVVSVFWFWAAPRALSQMAVAGGQQATPQSNGVDSLATQLHMLTDVQKQPPGVDKREFADYKAFYSENREPAKKIELGKAFLQKYPKSTLTEAVDAELVDAYVDRQDLPDAYSSADAALALKPDDVDVLTTVGWVIPHFYQADDPGADALLTKAETYEKHALQVMATMPKPAGVPDAQFAALKTQKTFQAHSALGLVYFRREDYDNSEKELRQAVENPHADPADLFVLGVDLQNLKRPGEAANIFGRCAAMPSDLQERCKDAAAETEKISSQPK